MKLTEENFKIDYMAAIHATTARQLEDTSSLERYNALGQMIKDYIGSLWANTNASYRADGVKQVYYFSMEFLTGKFLENNLHYLGIYDVTRKGLRALNIDLEDLIEVEMDQGLGNGGLGRLAACFLDAMSSISIPGHGCGIRYKNGLFEQKIIDGNQVEFPDRWLVNNNVWEYKRPNKAVEIRFNGHVETYMEEDRLCFKHVGYDAVRAVPYDTPILGYENNTVNTLRLWSAEEIEDIFDFEYFSKGNYLSAFEKKHSVEIITQILYPNDAYDEGKLLRLKQEYFFVSAGIQSIITTFKKLNLPMTEFSDRVAIHINDTHPALAVPELMRILVDEERLDWDTAWRITTNCISYTNHTIMAEALEKWPLYMMKDLLPRVTMVIEEINRRFIDTLKNIHQYTDENKIHQMAIINDGIVKMAHLAIVGSHSINGVAELHTEILKTRELKDFHNIYPTKFNNKTNGIMHRHWLLNANPRLTDLIEDTIGDGFKKNPIVLRDLLKYREDKAFLDKLYEIKHQNKEDLAKFIKDKLDISVDPYSIFDMQAKRIHEYKRQHMNILHVMHLYNQLKENPNLDMPPRTFIFAGKSAPSYYVAKQIIKLINTVGHVINNDKTIKNKLKVVFLPNYGVSLAGRMIPAADVSEQISTASKEASGTGNMKFMMNGAVTLATLDGANIEIRKEVGENNIVIFGLRDKDVYDYYKNGNYNAFEVYNADPALKKVIDQLINSFLPVPKDEFIPIVDRLLRFNDEYFVLKDFEDYRDAQERIGLYYRNKPHWMKMSLTNIACSGAFSADYTIDKYASGIWHVNRKSLDFKL
ncbi:glycogen/starch/alpha-glucan phosphorylase [Fusibacter ferrireducens]|uniref:Alpha-1,4 glucan phosphorylase n=1 Tax=Fusibacter ferrireducens TaxID=2785058 RepID=A0ABR9ZVZ2_9FIRM|nr:glycogen/starch/alpha-glucan phosphorylase [Fusibacter ferrireducens]MBF4694633.1 glycogen/starch/alpha-glucan phosphorylase [Fusibacter ferrireducens]